MVLAALLRIRRETGGAWCVQLGDGDSRPAEARLAPELAGALVTTIREDLRPPLVVIEDGDDVVRCRREAEAGRRLGRVLQAPALAARLVELLTRARLAEGRLALAVDAEGEIQALPWELLATGPEGAALDESGGAVVRLANAPAPLRAPPRGGRLRVLLGCPTPEDPDCAAVLAALEALLERLGFDPPVRVDPLSEGRLPPPQPERVDLLHYVCHGDFLHEAFVLQSGDRPRLPGVLVGQMAGDLGRLPLVVLDVCGAGDPGQAPLSTLVGQMLQGSAQAVLAPARAATVAASAALSQGLYRALGRGASVVQAVGEARSQVRTLAHPHPSARAANFLLSVSRLSALLSPPPLDRSWIPEGWARPDAGLRALLTRAQQLALEEESGHVGIEHLVRALRSGEGGAISARLRGARDPHLERELRALSATPMPGRTGCVATPRVQSLLRDAPEGASIEDLWRALIRDPHHGLHALVAQPLELMLLPPSKGGPTPLVPAATVSLRPLATGLQQVWGPMDGQILRPKPGQTLGRFSTDHGPDLPLYPPDLPDEDAMLSRRHVQWLGPGQLLALRPLRHLSAGRRLEQATPVEGGIVELRCGELLLLTPRTWLRGMAV